MRSPKPRLTVFELQDIADALSIAMSDIQAHLQVAKYNARGEQLGELIGKPKTPLLIHERGIEASEKVIERCRIQWNKIWKWIGGELPRPQPSDKEHVFCMRVVASEGPTFGGYLQGSASDGEALIAIDVLACLAVNRDPKKTCAEVLCHEVLHACQELMGEQLTETDIEQAQARIDGVELKTCESDAQHAEELLRQIQELGEKVQTLESENAALRAQATA